MFWHRMHLASVKMTSILVHLDHYAVHTCNFTCRLCSICYDNVCPVSICLASVRHTGESRLSGSRYQWRRQDLLWGGAKMNLCHGELTADFRAGCSSCSMTNSFVTNAVLIERAVSCWHLRKLTGVYTILEQLADRLLQSELKWNCWKSRGTCPSALAGDATAYRNTGLLLHRTIESDVSSMLAPNFMILNLEVQRGRCALCQQRKFDQ